MRRAVISVDDEKLAEFGFAAFQEAGLCDVEILSCDGPRGVSRMYLEAPPDERRLDENDAIQWWERVSSEGPHYVYLVEMNVAERLASMDVDADRILRAERADVRDGGFSLDQAGSHQEIGEMIENLEAAGFDVALEKLQDYHVEKTPLDALTDRQREVLTAAHELGYYDVPRMASTAAIAAELGLDDSTVSEHLQRAERNLLEALLG